MNKMNKIIAAVSIVIGTAFLGGCIKEGGFDTPPVNIPKVNFSSNTTISELQAMHTAGSIESINSDIIIKGTVVGNDKSGIIYKALYLADDTAGIEIPLDQSNLYSSYEIGQRVYVKCKGLALGESYGNLELGIRSGSSIVRIPSVSIPQYLFRDSLPGAAPVPATLLSTNFANIKNLNRLVKFDNIYFPDSNQVFCAHGASFTDHQMGNIAVSSLVLYATPYASYAPDTIPSGTGSVTGILVKYNTVYELMIRDLNDLTGFNSSK